MKLFDFYRHFDLIRVVRNDAVVCCFVLLVGVHVGWILLDTGPERSRIFGWKITSQWCPRFDRISSGRWSADRRPDHWIDAGQTWLPRSSIRRCIQQRMRFHWPPLQSPQSSSRCSSRRPWSASRWRPGQHCGRWPGTSRHQFRRYRRLT